jgi:hypothetical protein
MATLPVAIEPTRIIPLKHQVLAILSLAARQGRNRVPILDFFKAFADLTEEFGNVLPGLVFSRTAHSAYSKRLDAALQELVGSSVDIPNPKLQYLEVSSDAAGRHLVWLKEKYGEEQIDDLMPLVDFLLRKLPAE